MQCPNCGGYKVVAQNRGLIRGAWLWFIFGGWAASLVGCLLLSVVLEAQDIGAMLGSLLGGLALLALGVGPLILAYNAVNKTTRVECSICGYKWDYSK